MLQVGLNLHMNCMMGHSLLDSCNEILCKCRNLQRHTRTYTAWRNTLSLKIGVGYVVLWLLCRCLNGVWFFFCVPLYISVHIMYRYCKITCCHSYRFDWWYRIFLRDGSSPHSQTDIRASLSVVFPGTWIGWVSLRFWKRWHSGTFPNGKPSLSQRNIS